MSCKCSGAYLEAATGWPIPSIYLTRINLYARDKRVLGLYLAKFSELACRDNGMMVVGEKSQNGAEKAPRGDT
jgi:hypothetical protein